jgi:hypothetical protein
METAHTCALCCATDSPMHLTGWFVNGLRLTVHTECWIAAYREERHRHRSAA